MRRIEGLPLCPAHCFHAPELIYNGPLKIMKELAPYILPIAIALLLSLLLTPLVRLLARRVGMVAKPKIDRWHKKPTALLGGMAIFAAAALESTPPLMATAIFIKPLFSFAPLQKSWAANADSIALKCFSLKFYGVNPPAPGLATMRHRREVCVG